MLAERPSDYKVDDFVPTPEVEARIEAKLSQVSYELTETQLQDIFGDGGDYFRIFKSDIRATRLLTAEEEVAFARSGDYDSLAFNNIRLVFGFAARYATRACPFVDLAQEGFVGLMHAVHGYNPNLINPETQKPYRFSTYAYRWIWYTTWSYVKKEKLYARDIELDAPAFRGSDEPLSSFLADLNSPIPEEQYFDQEASKKIHHLIREEIGHLHRRAPSLARAIERGYGIAVPEQTAAEIADELGIEEGTVRMYQTNGRRALRRSPRLQELARSS